MDLYQNSYGAYIQDDLRLTDRITLNLGLRYELNMPVTEGKNELSVPDLTAESANCTPKPGCLHAMDRLLQQRGGLGLAESPSEVRSSSPEPTRY